MPYTGGQIQSARAEAAARKRAALEVSLADLEECYQRRVRDGTTHHPDAQYLKQLIAEAKQQLRGR